MTEGVSIFNIIKRGGYEASIITTFNAHLPFYEEVVLRKLVSAGCRHNVVLMDKKQCAQAWHNESNRPNLAGFAYTLIPVEVSGAFHPKVCILAGPKRASILIGSHNLTLSGFGYNQEVTNWIEVEGVKDTGGGALLKATWVMLNKWIELERLNLAEGVLESARALLNIIRPLIANAGASEVTQVLSQEPGSPSLFDAIHPYIPANVDRIAILGAFFDHGQEFIRTLHQQFPFAEIVVGIDPTTVYLPGQPDTAIARYVDVGPLFEKERCYLHAKVILFDNGVESNAVLVSGSANPSRQAWLTDNGYGNVEAVLLRSGKEAYHSALEMKLFDIFTLTAIEPALLSDITTRALRTKESNGAPSTPVWGAIMLPETGELRIQCASQLPGRNRVVLLDQNETELEVFDDVTVEAREINITPNCEYIRIRSCLIYLDSSILARAIVSHQEQLRKFSRPSRQHQIQRALGALGSSEGDISAVIAMVQRVIFADDNISEIEAAIHQKKQLKLRGSTATSPETLAVSVNEIPKTKRKTQLLKSGDLAYLIDILMRRLSSGYDQSVEERDRHGRSEEEQVGQDDEDSLEVPVITLTDLAIAQAVSLKTRALIRKMVRQFCAAPQGEAKRVSIVIQLIAVLALLRELRRLDKTKRWRQTGQSLAEEQDLHYFFNHCLEFLLSSRSGSLYVIDETIGEGSEETAELIVLLLWLAWDLGLELTEHVGKLWDAAEQKSSLKNNEFFLRLLPVLVKDSAAQQVLEESIAQTIHLTPAAQLRASRWLDYHMAFGRLCTKGFIKLGEVAVGGYCVIPGVIEEPRVVFSTSGNTVSVWDFDREISFVRDKVVAVFPTDEGDGAVLEHLVECS